MNVTVEQRQGHMNVECGSRDYIAVTFDVPAQAGTYS
jgi:hypothetical protein